MKRKITYIISFALAITLFCISTIGVTAAGFKSSVETSSKYVYMANLDTNTVVYEKNSQEKCYPASLTKIMTYIVVAESVKDTDGTLVEIKQAVLDTIAGTDSSVSGLYSHVGKKMSVTDLLYCLMVSSGNDAAVVLADYVGGGDQNKFMEKMNAKAKQLGMNNSHFVNPHGLQDKEHYTTAQDVYKMTEYAVTLPNFTQITDTVNYTLGQDEDGNDQVLTTTNKMINENSEGEYFYKYAKGIKTGTTDEAGYCLASSAVNGGYAYICITMGAPCYDGENNDLGNGAMKDAKALYEWAFNSLELKAVVGENDPICEAKVNYAWDKKTVLLTPEFSYSTIMPKDIQTKDIQIKTNVPENIDTPIKEGQVVGTATLEYNGEVLTKVNLIADEAVDRSELKYLLEIAKNVVTSSWFLIALGVIIALFIGYVILVAVSNKKDKETKKFK